MAKRKTPPRGKGGKFVKRSTRRRRVPRARKKGTSMARKRRRRSTSTPKRRTSRRRRSGGGGTSRREQLIAIGAAAAWGWAENKASAGDLQVASILNKMPVVTPIGRVGTAAVIAAALHHFGYWRRWTGPISVGLGAVAAQRFGSRGLKFIEDRKVAEAIVSGEDETYLAGEVGAEDVIDIAA